MGQRVHATNSEPAARPQQGFGPRLKHAISRFAYPLVALLALAAAMSSNS